MDYTLEENYNKSYSMIEDYQLIIYKYLESRKNSPIREILGVMTKAIFPIIGNTVSPIHEILGYIYLSLAQDKADPAIVTFLESSPFQEGILSDDEIQLLLDKRKEVVEFLCIASSSRVSKYANYVQPYYLDEVVISALNELPKGSTIYNPNAGINSYAIAAPQYHFFGEEYSLPSWVIGQIRLFIHQIDADIKREYPKKNVTNKKYDAVIIDTFSTGKVGFGVGNIEKQIRSTYRSINEEGKLIFHCSSEILLGTTTSGDALGNLRKWMIEEKCISSVVLLPNNILRSQRFMQSTVQSVLIIIEKKTHQSIRMIDGSESYIRMGGREKAINSNDLIRLLHSNSHDCSTKCIDVTYEEISKNTILLPTYYLLQQSLRQRNLSNLVALRDLLIPYRNEYICSDEKLCYIYSKDLSDNIATAMKDFSEIDAKVCSEKGTLLDKDNLLLFSIYSGVLRCSIFKKTDGVKVMCSNQIQVFEVHSSISDIEFFVSELFESYVQEQINTIISPYRSLANNTNLLLNIMISIPSDSNHNAVNRTFERKLKAQEKIIKATGLQLEQLQNKELNDFVHTMRVRKHAIAQVLNSVAPAIDVLKMTLEKNGGVLKATDVILRRSGTTFEGYLDRIHNQVNKIVTMVDMLTDGTEYGAPSVVSVYELIEKYKEKLIDDQFSLKVVFTSESGFFLDMVADTSNQHFTDYKLSIDPKDFYQLLDNIVSNAKKYGFVHSEKDYIIQISAMPYQLNGKEAVLLSVMNNGESLAKGMTPEKVFTIGEHAGKGDGIGGWQMKNIVEHYGGAIDLINSTDDDSFFKIEYQIVLPIIESYELYD